MPISPADVLKVARLAHLRLTESEAESFARQLGSILDYIRKLESLPQEPAQAGASPPPGGRLRDDEPRPSLPRDRALAAAPESEAGLFRVPPVI